MQDEAEEMLWLRLALATLPLTTAATLATANIAIPQLIFFQTTTALITDIASATIYELVSPLITIAASISTLFSTTIVKLVSLVIGTTPAAAWPNISIDEI